MLDGIGYHNDHKNPDPKPKKFTLKTMDSFYKPSSCYDIGFGISNSDSEFIHHFLVKSKKSEMLRNEHNMEKFASRKMIPEEFFRKQFRLLLPKSNRHIYDKLHVLPEKYRNVIDLLFGIVGCLFEIRYTFSIPFDEYEKCFSDIDLCRKWIDIKYSIEQQYDIYRSVLEKIIEQIITILSIKPDINWNEYSISHFIDIVWKVHSETNGNVFTFPSQYEKSFNYSRMIYSSQYNFSTVNYTHELYTMRYNQEDHINRFTPFPCKSKYHDYILSRQNDLDTYLSQLSKIVSDDLINIHVLDEINDEGFQRISYN